MSFSTLILEFLKNHAEITVAGFGTFYLKNTNAMVETDRKSILPPGKEVAYSDSIETQDNSFANFMASQRNISLAEAQAEIKKQVVFWNSTLEKEGQLNVEDIGTFSLNDSKIHFTGARLNNATPDFYGLEEINLAEINKPSHKNTGEAQAYQTSRSWIWILALILVLGGISYFAVTQPELIFGKKSFAEPAEKSQVKTPLKAAITDSTSGLKTLDSTKPIPQRQILPETLSSKKIKPINGKD